MGGGSVHCVELTRPVVIHRGVFAYEAAAAASAAASASSSSAASSAAIAAAAVVLLVLVCCVRRRHHRLMVMVQGQVFLLERVKAQRAPHHGVAAQAACASKRLKPGYHM